MCYQSLFQTTIKFAELHQLQAHKVMTEKALQQDAGDAVDDAHLHRGVETARLVQHRATVSGKADQGLGSGCKESLA